MARKLKKSVKIGILTAGLSLAGYTNHKMFSENQSQIDAIEQVAQPTPEKRTAEKVYHLFDDIPEIPDEQASLYSKDEYTYIINGHHYQRTGNIRLKRVLKDEISHVNTLSLIYRSECATYNPKENEDQLKCYVDDDQTILSPSGLYVGCAQMNKDVASDFIKYLAVMPETKKAVSSLLQQDNKTKEALNNYKTEILNKDGSLRPMDERNHTIHGQAFKAIRIKENAWKNATSAKLKLYISSWEKEKNKPLDNMIKNYLCLTELLPSDVLQKYHEQYILSFYGLGRLGKPKQVTKALASALQLTDKNGDPDATRLPLFAIAAPISHFNWQGNGCSILTEIPKLKKKLNREPDTTTTTLLNAACTWVTGKSRSCGVKEIAQLDYITNEQIEQYCLLELSGAENLKKRYLAQTKKAEKQVSRSQNENKNDSINKKNKISQLTAKLFIQHRSR